MTPATLKRIRLELGLSQQALAERLGVDRTTVARWETGTRGISELAARLVQRIAAEARGQAKGKRTRRGR